MKEEIMKGVVNALSKAFDENQKQPNQYVVVFRTKDGDNILGYNSSTFCQLTDDIMNAKRYTNPDVDKQLATIWKNFQSVLKTTEEDTKVTDIRALFATLMFSVKKNYFMDVKEEDVYIDAVFLADGMEPQKLSAIIVNSKDDGRVPEA